MCAVGSGVRFVFLFELPVSGPFCRIMGMFRVQSPMDTEVNSRNMVEACCIAQRDFWEVREFNQAGPLFSCSVYNLFYVYRNHICR